MMNRCDRCDIELLDSEIAICVCENCYDELVDQQHQELFEEMGINE